MEDLLKFVKEVKNEVCEFVLQKYDVEIHDTAPLDYFVISIIVEIQKKKADEY